MKPLSRCCLFFELPFYCLFPPSNCMTPAPSPALTNTTSSSSKYKERLVKFHSPNPSHPTNVIYTTKYTLYSFLPRFLYEQFSKAANMFFGTIAMLQQIPSIAPTSRYATIVPLSFVLTVSAVRELYEDWKRLRADKKMNNKLAEVVGSDGEPSRLDGWNCGVVRW